MADIAETLKGILGDDAEDKIKNVLGSMPQSESKQQSSGTDLGQLMQLKSMIEGMTMNRNEPGANLLMSLKPYMRESRQGSIDGIVRLIGIMNIIKLLGR